MNALISACRIRLLVVTTIFGAIGLLQQYKDVGVAGAVGTNNIAIIDRDGNVFDDEEAVVAVDRQGRSAE